MCSVLWRASIGALFLAVVMVAGGLTPAAASTGESCLPSGLKSKLYEIRSRFGPITVVSTHREGAKIRGSGKRSYHADCRAVDFVPPKGKYAAVTRWLYSNHSGSVGTYTCMNHIHIDNGPNLRWSKCR